MAIWEGQTHPENMGPTGKSKFILALHRFSNHHIHCQLHIICQVGDMPLPK